MLTIGVGSDPGDEPVWKAVSRERNRLAEALHDGALQDLAMAQQNWAEASSGDVEALTALHDDLARLARELRALTGALHEDTLEEIPLHRALARALDGLPFRSRLDVTLAIDPQADRHRGPFLRQTVRELVANVAQHTDATCAVVTVTEDDTHLILCVIDDGDGFDRGRAAAASTNGHLGLRRIERTVAQLGGTFTIAPSPPRGTTATVRVPTAALAPPLEPGTPSPDASDP